MRGYRGRQVKFFGQNKRKKLSFATLRWLLLGAGLILLIGELIFFFTRLPNFRVQQIYFREDGKRWMPLDRDLAKIDARHILNKNIFTLDLGKEALYFSDVYPEYKKIKLIRVLPNRIFIDCLRRHPVACVRLYRNFWVDDNLYLFELSHQDKSIENLPVITGVASKIIAPRPGKRYPVRELYLAVDILRQWQEVGIDNLAITSLDLTDYDRMLFQLAPKTDSNGEPNLSNVGGQSYAIEIRIWDRGISSSLRLLSQLLVQLKDRLAQIEYVDLRFNEPVIKFRDGG